MNSIIFSLVFVASLVGFGALRAKAEDPYRFFTWAVTYGKISPLGVAQQVGGNFNSCFSSWQLSSLTWETSMAQPVF